MRILCYFDGACPGNQFVEKGAMKAAYIIEEREFLRDVPDLPTSRGPLRSNNIAEYHALLYLLEDLVNLESTSGRKSSYRICGDSQLVVRQMIGGYRVRQPHLVPLHAKAVGLVGRLDVEFQAIPREANRAGHLLERLSDR